MQDAKFDTPSKKDGHLYILARLYCVGIVPLVLLAWPNVPEAYAGLLPLACIPALLLALNLVWFPFNYSVFGSYERKRRPNSEAMIDSSGMAGVQKFPLISLALYPSGIEVSVLFMGSAFIPFEEIVTLSMVKHFGCIIEHKSREFRSSLHVSDRDFCLKVKQLQQSKTDSGLNNV